MSVQIYQFIYRYLPFLTPGFYIRLSGYYNRIPVKWKFIELSVAALSLIFFGYLYLKKKIRRNEATAYWLLISYAALVLISTVFSREKMTERVISYVPFISYWEWIRYGNMDLFWEDLYNIIMFIPFGFLLHGKCGIKKSWLASILFSIVIETLQLIFCKGTCELDDIINNGIGFFVGYGIAFLLKKIWNKIMS